MVGKSKDMSQLLKLNKKIRDSIQIILEKSLSKQLMQIYVWIEEI